MKTAVIINPRAGGGEALRRRPSITRLLESCLGPMTVRLTEGCGHATVLVRDLLHEGFHRFIAVGGDGTIHEAANGFFDGDRNVCPEACLGVLPFGTGGDFRRMLGMPIHKEDAAKALASAVPHPIDIGRARFRSYDGATQRRVFINLVSFGLGGEVARRSRNLLSPASGTAAYLWATAAGFLSYRERQVRLTLDECSAPISFSITNVAIGNGAYHGGGMHVCPQAVMDDGIFEVTVIERLGLFETARDLSVLYSDDIYRHPKVHYFRARRFAAGSDETVHIEIDGEAVGMLPLEITMLPRSLRVLVPRGSPLLGSPAD
jgi:YegS/Rv2252/BmrU family lipid kinase